MKPASERFVLDMVRACMPRTMSGIRFDYGSHYMSQGMERTGGPGAYSGVMSIKIDGVEPSLHVTYSLLVLDEGNGVTFSEGRCTIQIGNDQDRSWEFYCQRQSNGLLRVRTMIVMRQCRALKESVRAMLRDLGGNSGAITRQLQKMGYAPDIEGLKQLIGRVFALTDVEIALVKKPSSVLPEIRGHRANDPDLELRLYNPSGVIGSFLTQQLTSNC